MNKNDVNRRLTLWAVTFFSIAVILFFYFKAPLLPLLLAGISTFCIVVVRYFSEQQKRKNL